MQTISQKSARRWLARNQYRLAVMVSGMKPTGISLRKLKKQLKLCVNSQRSNQ